MDNFLLLLYSYLHMKYQYQKGFAPLVIILLVVLGIGVVGGGYVFYENKQQQEKLETQIQDLQNQPVGDTSNTTTPKVVDEIQTSATEKLVITFPIKGTVLVEGQTYNITWDGISISSATHGVFLEDKNGSSIGLMSETGASISAKSISWKVLNLETFGERKILPGDGFRIVIFPKGKYPQEAYYSPVFKIVAPENKNPTVSLAVQAGLPPVVEAKRQAIYRAAVEKNYSELAVLYNGNLNNVNDFRDNWLPVKTQEIITTLQMSFEFQPYIPPPSGHTSGIEARYTWPLNHPELSQLRIVISESGKWIYVGAGD